MEPRLHCCQMQQLSYEGNDPWFEIDGWHLAVQIITFENVYGLDPDSTVVASDAGRTTIDCRRLTWAEEVIAQAKRYAKRYLR